MDLLPKGLSEELLCSSYLPTPRSSLSGGVCSDDTGSPAVRFFNDKDGHGRYVQMAVLVGGIAGCQHEGGRETASPAVLVRLDHPRVRKFIEEVISTTTQEEDSDIMTDSQIKGTTTSTVSPLHAITKPASKETSEIVLTLDGAGPEEVHAIIAEGHVIALRELLAAGGVDVNAAANLTTLRAPLHVACEMGHTGIVRLLLRQPRIDVDRPDVEGSTPLHICARKGFVEATRALVAAGANVNITKRLLTYTQKLTILSYTD